MFGPCKVMGTEFPGKGVRLRGGGMVAGNLLLRFAKASREPIDKERGREKAPGRQGGAHSAAGPGKRKEQRGRGVLEGWIVGFWKYSETDIPDPSRRPPFMTPCKTTHQRAGQDCNTGAQRMLGYSDAT